MTRFILLRHGQTDWNLQRKYQGHADIPLNDTGIQQAFSASEALRNESFDVAFSSDLTRARTTAETVLRYHPRTSLIINSIFRERAFGVLEGTPYQRDLLNPTIRESIDRDPYGHKFDNGGESLLDVYARADEAHRMIRAAYPDQTVLVISHGTFLSLFLVILKGLPISARKGFVIDNASPIYVGTDGETDDSVSS